MFNFFKKSSDSLKTSNGLTSFKSAISKTSSALVKNILNAVSSNDEIDEHTLEDIESILIKADLGVDLSTQISEKIKKENIKASDIKRFLKSEFENILSGPDFEELKYDKNKLNIYFIVGVNGAGKTTLIGKLASKFKNEKKKVLLAAGDTYRAAAEEQLDIWAKTAGVDIVRRDKADSASVVFEAIQKAKDESFDTLIVDTAGRLQNKFNLIEELKKVKNVITKNAPDAVIESILVLDAALGQNGLNQAKVFNEAVDLTSVAITKLDGSSKGGIILSVCQELNLPTKLVGIGEKIEDLKSFNKTEFIEALFD